MTSLGREPEALKLPVDGRPRLARGQPTIETGCHGHWRDAVAERMAGRRLACSWLSALGRLAADDVDL